jgi:DNA-binding NarL/FixJ family response regulator
MIRVMLADDHEVMRKGLRGLLEEQKGLDICAEATNGREAVELAKKHRPAVVVMDLMMPEMTGLEATRHIRKALPQTEVLIYTLHESEKLVRDVFSAGARGYVLKSDAAKYLVTAVESLARHKPFFTNQVAEIILGSYAKPSPVPVEQAPATGPLTEREREVVRLLAAGKSNKEVAIDLGISVKTVETHRATIMRKLELNSVVELVHYAIRTGLCQP